MVFKAGVIYMLLSMQALMGAYNVETKKAEVMLEYGNLEKILVVDSEKEAMELAPQIMDIIMENQKDFIETPRIIKYETNSSHVIVTFDPKFFENK